MSQTVGTGTCLGSTDKILYKEEHIVRVNEYSKQEKKISK